MKNKILILLAIVTASAFAASTYTSHYNLEKPADGDANWGNSYRTNLDTIDTTLYANSASTATPLNTPSAIVSRDGSGNFAAGTITATLTGNASTASALAADPADCTAGGFATSISANGNLTCSIPTGTQTLTTKGDLQTYSGGVDRLGVGANTFVLTADSAEATGLKWAAVASGSVAIGAAISGSTGSKILYTDASGLLSESSNFAINPSNQNITITETNNTGNAFIVNNTYTGSSGSGIGAVFGNMINNSSGYPVAGVYGKSTLSGSGDNAIGVAAQVSNGGLSSKSGVGFFVDVGSGNWTNYYGMYIGGAGAGTVTGDNYALYIASNNSYFGGRILQDGSADAVQVNVQGHSTQTSNIVNVEKSDGTDLFSVGNTSVSILDNTLIDGVADEVQLNVQGHSTQTSNILNVEKSDSTDLLSVTNVNGTHIKGTTTNDSAASGIVGERVSSTVNATNAPTSNTWGDLTSISLTAGDWDVSLWGAGVINGAVITSGPESGISSTSGNSATGLTTGDNRSQALPPTTLGDSPFAIPNYRVSLSATTTYYFKMKISYSSGTPQFYGRISARRVR